VNPGQLAALRAIAERPIYLERDVLPEGAPSAQCLAELEAMQYIRIIGEGENKRWAVSRQGNWELKRWSPAGPHRRWPL
jgi:hypothetical protein